MTKGPNVGKRTISIRLDGEIVEALDAWAEEHGTSRTDAITTAITALTEAQEAAEGNGRAETHDSDPKAVLEVLRASNSDLRQEVSRLWAQLATKDAQLETAQKTLDQEQRLHAITAARSLPGEAEGKTLRQRITEFFRRAE